MNNQIPDLWWSPSHGGFLTRHENNADEHLVWIVHTTHESLRHHLGTGADSNPPLPDDAVRLVVDDPEQRRPVVLLRAEDCACPVGGDCSHGPEPVDALDLAALQARIDDLKRSYELKVQDFARETARVSAGLRACTVTPTNEHVPREVVGEALLGWRAAQEHIGDAIRNGALRAALQGDQPAEPEPEVIKLGWKPNGLGGWDRTCTCEPDCCLGEGDPPNRCEHCATIDGELPCPIADAEPTGEVDRG